MERGDQRRELFLGDVLQLVDEHRQRRVALPGRGAGDFQQVLEVMLQVPVVGQAGLGIEVKPDLDVGELHLEGLREAGESAQRPRGDRLCLLVP